MEAQPLISVIMRSYNYAGFIRQAIDSVLRQTVPELELIIVDDASSDGSQDIIRAAAAADSRIRSIMHAANKGMAAGMSEGMAAARGAYVAFIDSDDLWEPDKLRRQLAALKEHPDCAAVWTEGRIINEQGVPTGEKFTQIRWGKNRQKSGDLSHELVKGNFLFVSSFLGKADAVKACPFWTELRYLNDWSFHFDMAMLGAKYHFMPEELTLYRVHSRSTERDRKGFIEDGIVAHRMLIKRYGRRLTRAELSHLYYALGDLYEQNKQCRPARWSMFKAYLADRSNADARYRFTTCLRRDYPALAAFVRKLKKRGAK